MLVNFIVIRHTCVDSELNLFPIYVSTQIISTVYLLHLKGSKNHGYTRWKNVNTEEGRKNYQRLRNKLKRATDNAKKEYLENICN